MFDVAKEIVPITIEEEMKQSYLDYAMSVIVGRALPDVRDGLKPVHRRIVFAMNEMRNDWNKPYKKSARVVGDVIGKYHPHGDTAVYDSLVRMAQSFSMRYLLIDGQGNFGSVDGDMPAAMRYTEVRLKQYAHALMADLGKDTVDFSPNYDESEFAPDVLPTQVPNLLLNGASGIAVGMATNIPPHNLSEVVDACIALIHDPSLDIPALMQHIPGPDFPTAGILNGRAGVVDAYTTGRGRLLIRARAHIETEERTGHQTIIVTELPYQVNKARLIDKIGDLIKAKEIEGISALRDESDKDGMRMVIEVRRGDSAEVLLNTLYAMTPMESSFGVNMVALVDGQPRLLNLKQILEAFLRHRQTVVHRRTRHDLRKARERAHLLEGLGVALAHIDPIIATIKQSASPQEAKETLLQQLWSPEHIQPFLGLTDHTLTRPEELPEGFGMCEGGYRMSLDQVQALLDLKLQRLTALQQQEILDEYRVLCDTIKEYIAILEDVSRLKAVMVSELEQTKVDFADQRRTQLMADSCDLHMEDLIPEEQLVVTLSQEGYAKAQPLEAYQAQRRGGRGKSATQIKEEDVIAQFFITNSHATMLCFSSTGKVYWLKGYQFPQGSRNAKGKPMVNVLPLAPDESISAILPLPREEDVVMKYIMMVTLRGVVKKVAVQDFSRPRSSGIIAVGLEEGDRLVSAQLTSGEDDIMLLSDAGKAVRFAERGLRCMGRTARGVRGITLPEGARVIAALIVDPEATILTATAQGYGKRTLATQYPTRGRGTQGVISIQTTERNGHVIGAVQLRPGDQVMLLSDRGTMVRIRSDEIAQVGRNTQGVRLIQLQGNEQLISLQAVPAWQCTDMDEDTPAPNEQSEEESVKDAASEEQLPPEPTPTEP